NLILEFSGSISKIQKQIEDSGIKMKMTNHWASLQDSWWRISRSDYLRYFKSPCCDFVREDLTKVLSIIEGSKGNANYTNLMSKYEETINIIYVTLMESLAHNGTIIEEVAKEAVKML